MVHSSNKMHMFLIYRCSAIGCPQLKDMFVGSNQVEKVQQTYV